MWCTAWHCSPKGYFSSSSRTLKQHRLTQGTTYSLCELSSFQARHLLILYTGVQIFSALQISKHFAGGVCQPYLFFPCSKGGSALDHFVDEASQAEVVRAEGVLLVVDDFWGHVPHSADPTSNHFTLRDLQGQAKVGDSDMAIVIKQDVLGLQTTKKM